jgi:hypothetical protein
MGGCVCVCVVCLLRGFDILLSISLVFIHETLYGLCTSSVTTECTIDSRMTYIPYNRFFLFFSLTLRRTATVQAEGRKQKDLKIKINHTLLTPQLFSHQSIVFMKPRQKTNKTTTTTTTTTAQQQQEIEIEVKR